MRHHRHEDGYRYIRAYWVRRGTVKRYQLWERRAGRMRRVGTAHTERDYVQFLMHLEEIK